MKTARNLTIAGVAASVLGRRSRRCPALAGATFLAALRADPLRRLPSRPGLGQGPEVHRGAPAGAAAASGRRRPYAGRVTPLRRYPSGSPRPPPGAAAPARSRRGSSSGSWPPAAGAVTARSAGGPGERRRRRCRAARRRRARSSRPRTSSRPSWTTPTTGAGSQPPTRSRTSTRWAASRWSRSTCSPGRVTPFPFELAREVLRGGADVCARGRLLPRRRPQHRRPRTQVRPGGHRARAPRSAAAQRRRGGGSAADADQAARPGGAQQPAQDHRRASCCGGRGHDHSQPRRVASGAGCRRGARPT